MRRDAEGSLHRRLEASKPTRRDGDEDGVERSLQGSKLASKQARRDGEMRSGGEEPAMKTRRKQARRDGEMKSGRRGARKEN